MHNYLFRVLKKWSSLFGVVNLNLHLFRVQISLSQIHITYLSTVQGQA